MNVTELWAKKFKLKVLGKSSLTTDLGMFRNLNLHAAFGSISEKKIEELKKQKSLSQLEDIVIDLMNNEASTSKSRYKQIISAMKPQPKECRKAMSKSIDENQNKGAKTLFFAMPKKLPNLKKTSFLSYPKFQKVGVPQKKYLNSTFSSKLKYPERPQSKFNSKASEVRSHLRNVSLEICRMVDSTEPIAKDESPKIVRRGSMRKGPDYNRFQDDWQNLRRFSKLNALKGSISLEKRLEIGKHKVSFLAKLMDKA